jgi:hypothetical protein
MADERARQTSPTFTASVSGRLSQYTEPQVLS